MTRTCSVGTCFSRSNQNNSVSMFRFPLDIARTKIWVMRACNTTINANSTEHLHNVYRICRKHFKNSDFLNANEKKLRLVKNAIPSLFVTINLEAEKGIWPIPDAPKIGRRRILIPSNIKEITENTESRDIEMWQTPLFCPKNSGDNEKSASSVNIDTEKSVSDECYLKNDIVVINGSVMAGKQISMLEYIHEDIGLNDEDNCKNESDGRSEVETPQPLKMKSAASSISETNTVGAFLVSRNDISMTGGSFTVSSQRGDTLSNGVAKPNMGYSRPLNQPFTKEMLKAMQDQAKLSNVDKVQDNASLSSLVSGDPEGTIYTVYKTVKRQSSVNKPKPLSLVQPLRESMQLRENPMPSAKIRDIMDRRMGREGDKNPDTETTQGKITPSVVATSPILLADVIATAGVRLVRAENVIVSKDGKISLLDDHESLVSLPSTGLVINIGKNILLGKNIVVGKNIIIDDTSAKEEKNGDPKPNSTKIWAHEVFARRFLSGISGEVYPLDIIASVLSSVGAVSASSGETNPKVEWNVLGAGANTKQESSVPKKAAAKQTARRSNDGKLICNEIMLKHIDESIQSVLDDVRREIAETEAKEKEVTQQFVEKRESSPEPNLMEWQFPATLNPEDAKQAARHYDDDEFSDDEAPSAESYSQGIKLICHEIDDYKENDPSANLRYIRGLNGSVVVDGPLPAKRPRNDANMLVKHGPLSGTQDDE